MKTVQHGMCACSAACCDLAQFVAVCWNLMDSHVQQHVASSVFSCIMQCRWQRSMACVHAVLHAVI